MAISMVVGSYAVSIPAAVVHPPVVLGYVIVCIYIYTLYRNRKGVERYIYGAYVPG